MDYLDDCCDEELNDPCLACGPWCEHWGGDGLCMLEIEALADETAEFEEYCVHKDQLCPVCAKLLTMYDIPVDELWVWPGDFFSPIIGLNVYAVYDAPKGVLHSQGNVHHIWIGEGEGREEKLVRLMPELPF